MNHNTQDALNFKESLSFIQKEFGAKIPHCTLVLGSGLNKVVDAFKIEKTLSYSDIPHFPKSNIQGHSGKLHLGKIHDKTVLIFSGRFHYYQGVSNTIASAPAWISGFWNIPLLIATNAAGGINTTFQTGDMVLIRDHLFLQPENPLRGVMLPQWENPFIDMTSLYDEDFRSSLIEIAKENNLNLHQGVYVCVTGPSFETPAEIEMFGNMGADMVGMSTIPEIIVARKMGLKTIGLSMIANMAAGVDITLEAIEHKDVLASIQKTQGHLSKLLSEWFKKNP